MIERTKEKLEKVRAYLEAEKEFRTVVDISKALGFPIPTVYKFIGILDAKNLLESKKIGQVTLYKYR